MMHHMAATLSRIHGIEARLAQLAPVVARQAASSGLALGANPTSASAFQQTLQSLMAPKSAGTNPLLNAATSPLRRKIEGLIENYAGKFGVDPNLVKAVVHAESGFDPKAISKAGAKGLMQLMPETAKGLNVHNSFDIQQNLQGGIRYLGGLLNRYGGDVTKALAAYNAGPTHVDKHQGVPPFAETQKYVQKVMALYQAFQAQAAKAPVKPGGLT
jgi:soluble lytic murein transglycosylase-like protein